MTVERLPDPAANRSGLPHLRREGEATQLFVDEKPFLVLGGELGNSSASSLEYAAPIWPKLRALGLNTVLVPVYWDMLEPVEGAFDFTLVDGVIAGARAHGLRLILLWFGSWKNCMSCYVPAWIKTDLNRFPRAQSREKRGLEMLSAFHEENVAADARAFAALMRHVREIDAGHHTVIMVQVENEIGMIPEVRDHSDAADRHYRAPAPERLLEYLEGHRQTLAPELRAIWDRRGSKQSGAWEEVFGEGPATEEIFMAWHFARYVERVAAAGKAEHPLPMFVNAALIRPGYPPGRYASGGPLPHLINVWRAGAPSIDFLAPDIYFPNVAEWCRRYTVPGNPLFIPEIRRDPSNAAYAFYVMGAHSALGFSPFSIESIDETNGASLAEAYRLLDQLTPLITAHQGRDTLKGAAPEVAYEGKATSAVESLSLGGYTFNVTFDDPWASGGALPGAAGETADEAKAAIGGGLFIALGDDEFLVAGTGLTITFETEDPGGSIAGILSAEEGEFVDGRWTPGRRLNGDQTHQGRHIRIPPGEYAIQRFRLYRYR